MSPSSRQRPLLLVLVVAALLAGPTFAAATAVVARSAAPGVPAAPSNLVGYSADVGGDAANWCFDSVGSADFSAGDSVALSLVWDDVVDDSPGLESYTVTWGVLAGASPVILGPFGCDFDLSAFEPGQAVGLCCAFFTNPLPSPPQAASVSWGGKVQDPTGASVQGILGSFDVSP